MHKIIFGLAVLGLSSTTAFAQTPTSFTDVDADASGELSFVELQVAWPDLTQTEFDSADVNASGGLSADELNSLQPSALPATPTAPTPDAGTGAGTSPDDSGMSDDEEPSPTGN